MPAPKKNLTLRLDEDLIRQAKILAAQEGTSVSTLLARYVETSLGEQQAYAAAQRRASELMHRGFPLGGEPASQLNGDERP